MKENLQNALDALVAALSDFEGTEKEKIEAINQIRLGIHSQSPLKHHPVDCVLWVESVSVEGNEYNPNSVAPPEMRLLQTSIIEDGYTMPIVTFVPEEDKPRKIVDGFHRRKAERITEEIHLSTKGFIPVTNIRNTQSDESNRMASTIRHNRARGTHNIELMSEIVKDLVDAGKGDAWICKHVGMSKDELLRLKQVTGLASLFTDKEFSMAWEAGQ